MLTTVGNVLVAATVSAIVALAVELVAKPRLEIRKERLLDRHRRRWAMHKELAALVFILDRRASRAQGQIIAEHRTPRGTVFMTNDDDSLHVTGLDKALASLRDALAHVDLRDDAIQREAAMALVSATAILVFHEKQRPVDTVRELRAMQKAEDALVLDVIVPLRILAEEAVRTPGWRWRKRARIRAHLGELVKNPIV